MVRHDDGWWSAAVEGSGAGVPPAAVRRPSRSSNPAATETVAGTSAGEDARATTGSDYGFVLDGQGPFPDPRSPSQSAGVHGLSRLVDHAAFSWSDGGFQAPPLSTALVYELHIGTFTPEGTFDAAIERLGHLVQLGVTHVELMPVNEFPGARGWGYDGVDLFAPHHAYGGPDALKRLVNACHARGLAVVLDVVYNHLGPSGNYLSRFAPYFTNRYGTPWGPALNFDGPHSNEVRRFFCDNALMWLRDYHFDGLRLDAVHAIFDTSAVPFLEQLGAEVRELAAQLGRPLMLIPESDLNDPRLLWPVERGSFALDAQWSDDFHHALHAVLTGERSGYYEDFGALADLAKAMRNAYVYDGRHSLHRQRRHGRPPTGLSGHRFLAYAQNHDQIGNRARGERLSQLVSTNRLKIAAALVLTSPFVPLLFQGEEWGARTPFLFFSDHSEPALAQATREGRQREFAAFGWKPDEIPDPQAADTFARSKLDWSELSRQPHRELLDWHRRLIQLRRAEPWLTDGRLDRVQTRFDEAARWLVVERGPISVACNFAAHRQEAPLRSGNHESLLTSEKTPELTAAGVVLPPESVAILKWSEETRRP
ncbi:MAG: malto-oligosyltrehalose trehalohydrolase [Verrucomicrobia bacterium]|nr:malto-oligosyltrehalose trehalohydrolase [Verrucomicrobiota bacterium]